MITIFNTSLAQQGVVTNYSSLTFRRQLRGIGSFALSIAKDKKNTEYLIKGNVIAIDSTTAGVIVDVFEDQTENGVFLQVSGKALVGILGDRITKDTTTNYVNKTETIAKAIVNKNCIDATDTNRNFSNFDLIADSARGSSQTFDTLNEPLPKALERLLAIDNYGHQIYIDFANKKFKYDVIVNTNKAASVQFSNKIHNMKKSKSHQSNSNHKTFAYIDGNGVSNSYGSATGYSRKEIYLKDTKIDVEADLPDRASQDLSGKYYETNSIDAVIKVSGNPFVYKTDYDLGNIVSVNINGTLYELQITEITEIYTNQLVDIILTFGKAARSSSNIINDIKDIASQTIVSGGTSGGFPVGVLMPYALTTAPDGWLLCDGSAIDRTTYSDLFSAIGETYGVGDGITTFNVPDLTGKVIVGLDSAQTEFDTLGETGGAKTHTLTVDEIPAHNHGIPASSDSTPDGGTVAPASEDNDSLTLETPTRDAGGGLAHNNLQPYMVLNYIIKY